MGTHRWVGVDWGTSALRVALFDGAQVLAERHNDQGIVRIPAGGFAHALEQIAGDWLRTPGTRTLISGMAGSAQGWALAPYCPCPANLHDLSEHLLWLKAGEMALVPGLSCEHTHAPDVMRGEEVQVLGALALSGLRDATVVLPGTHSKWVQVREGRIMGFRTYMTGEVFAALRAHTILSRTLPTPDEDTPLDSTAFEAAVAWGWDGPSLLHTAFSTRTLALMSRASASALLSHLSGLVIAAELRDQNLRAGQALLVVGSATLQERYALALQHVGITAQCLGAEATWEGLGAIAQSLA